MRPAGIAASGPAELNTSRALRLRKRSRGGRIEAAHDPPPAPRVHRRWMVVQLEPEPLLALIAGVLILAMPRLLNYVVALYLILVGIVGLAH